LALAGYYRESYVYGFGANARISTKHIEQNLKDLHKGALPDDIVQALDDAWEKVRPVTSRYWHSTSQLMHGLWLPHESLVWGKHLIILALLNDLHHKHLLSVPFGCLEALPCPSGSNTLVLFSLFSRYDCGTPEALDWSNLSRNRHVLASSSPSGSNHDYYPFYTFLKE